MIKKLLMASVLIPMMGLAGSYTVSNTAADLGTISFPSTISGTLSTAITTSDGFYDTITFKPSQSGTYNVSINLSLMFGDVHTIKTTVYKGTLDELSNWTGNGSHSISFSTGNYYTIKVQMLSPSSYTTTKYSYTISIGGSSPPPTTKPDLVPYTPSGWSAPLVVTTSSSSSSSSSTFKDTDNIYVNFAVACNDASITKSFSNSLYVDGVLENTWTVNSLDEGYYTHNSSVYLLGKLSAGSHTLKLVADSGNDVSESNESNNTYTKTITVSASTTSYTVSFNAGGGSGSKASVSVTGGTYYTLPSCPFIRTDYEFAGWNATSCYTAFDNPLSVGSRILVTEDVVLTATWTYAPTTYTIYYNPGEYGTGSQQTATKTKDVALTLKGAIFTRKGYVQDGWTTADGDLYRLGDSFSGNVSMTFYPLWEPNKYLVSYVLNGGAFVSGGNQQEMHPDLVLFGDSFAVSPIERTGFVFTGWTVTSGLDSSTAKWLVAQKKAKVGEDSQNAVLNPYEEHGIESALKLCSPDDDGFVRFKNLTPVANGKVTLTANWTTSQFPPDDLNFVLSQGWTWVSVNVQPQDASFASVFKGVSFVDDDVIKSSGGSATYYGGTWYPSPSTFMFVPGRAYAVKKSMAGTATVTVGGTPAVPSLTVTAGWNWIGPTTDKPILLDALKHSGGFADDDVISSTSRSSTYYGGKWYGSLQSLEPGVGYKARFDNNGTISTQSNE